MCIAVPVSSAIGREGIDYGEGDSAEQDSHQCIQSSSEPGVVKFDTRQCRQAAAERRYPRDDGDEDE